MAKRIFLPGQFPGSVLKRKHTFDNLIFYLYMDIYIYMYVCMYVCMYMHGSAFWLYFIVFLKQGEPWCNDILSNLLSLFAYIPLYVSDRL